VGRQCARAAGAALDADAAVKATHGLESWLVGGVTAGLGTLSWTQSLRAGATLGDTAGRLGIRRRVAQENLAIAFPDRPIAEREAILRDHYRELGRVAAEYPRLGALVHAGPGEVVAEVHGLEHLEAAAAAGRGVILLTGHYGNFELLGAWLGRLNPVDFVVKGLSNPAVERRIERWRSAAGVGAIPIGSGVRRVFAALRQKRWVAMLADQDARSAGLFVPFFGRLTSTPAGPAAISLRSGAPILMGFPRRRPDGRHVLDVVPPFDVGRDSPEAVWDLTARHTACLETWVREHPAQWFWLHRRWKTPPPAVEASAATRIAGRA
jgi:KDO2-lipid IV(A) lauroyltransferase